MAISLLDGRTRYGEVRYFYSDRCIPTESLKDFNQGKLSGRELITFDCGLMEMQEITREEITKETEEERQILAIIIRPGPEPDAQLEREGIFFFCGYDLVEDITYTSAITNCGARFSQAIPYQDLTPLGLCPTYKTAVLTQLSLLELYPEESHAYCEIVEIWKKKGLIHEKERPNIYHRTPTP